ncbi:MAG: thiamine biosynthesis lipoprotein [Olleya marilimosa]|jgi:thiamine biosynthesis lipoprotein|nr:FAD:protein FMN transferase [Olleya marilimosa]
MGSSFDITVVADSQKQADTFINIAISEISRIEKLISSWDPNSQTSLINKNSGIKAVKVDLELFNLIDRALKISKLTNGAFDISYASMDQIWKFDGTMTEMPSKEAIKKSVDKVGYQNIILDKDQQTVFLKLEGMKIGFGAIGKGYAADKAKALLISKGVISGIINASGDLNTWGKQPNGDDWKVAIINPLNKEKIFSWLPVNNSAVVTSGNYEKYVKFNNILYTHIIDPRTGYPATGILSVTIFTKTAELADALATSIFVMGKDTGLDFVNQLKGVECIIIDENNTIITSKNIALNNLKHD